MRSLALVPWLVAAVTLLSACRCDRAPAPAAAPQRPDPGGVDASARARAGVLSVRALHVSDVSSAGARLPGVVDHVRAAVLQAGAPVRVTLEPSSPLDLELRLANLCDRRGCYLSAEAAARLPDEKGLLQRFRAVRMTPIEGLAFEPAVAQLRRSVLPAVAAWVDALARSDDEVAAWLRDDDADRLDAALQVVIDRGIAAAAGSLGWLLVHERRDVRLRAIAAVGVLDASRHTDALATIALGTDSELALAAVGSLMDLSTDAATDVLIRVAHKGVAQGAREAARSALGIDDGEGRGARD